jgi:hypothetical protein
MCLPSGVAYSLSLAPCPFRSISTTWRYLTRAAAGADLPVPGPQLYVPPDATYGRYRLPPLEEERYLESSPRIRTTKRRVFTDRKPIAHATVSDAKLPNGASTADALCRPALEAEDVELTQAELDRAKGREWVFWQSWELRDRRGRPGEGCDLLVVHGSYSSLQFSSDGGAEGQSLPLRHRRLWRPVVNPHRPLYRSRLPRHRTGPAFCECPHADLQLFGSYPASA